VAVDEKRYVASLPKEDALYYGEHISAVLRARSILEIDQPANYRELIQLREFLRVQLQHEVALVFREQHFSLI
jgi:hypothetical protein